MIRKDPQSDPEHSRNRLAGGDSATAGGSRDLASAPGGPDTTTPTAYGPGYGYGYGYGYGSSALGDSEVNLVHYLQILYRHRVAALTVFVSTVLVVTLYTLTTTPIYEGTVRILIEREDPNVVSFKEVLQQNALSDDYYETQYKILQSRGLARRVIDALNLWSHPQFNRPPRMTIRGVIMAPLNLVQGWFSGPEIVEPPGAAETRAQSRVINGFLGSLSVSAVRYSRLVDVGFESPEPALAARVANAVAREYIAQSLEFKSTTTKEASTFLTEQLAEQRKQVELSEQALQRYREQTDSVSLEDRQNVVVQKLSDLNAAVTRAKTERIQKEAAYNQIKAVQADQSAIDSVPVILSNPFVQQQKSELAELQRKQAQLAERLGPNHPEMLNMNRAVQTAESKLQGEIAKILQGMRNDYEAALAQEKSLMTALDQQKREAMDLNRKGIEYGTLQRAAATNRQMFESLMQRSKETGISGELKTSNIRVVDEAETPGGPVSPNTFNNLLLAVFGGLLFAVGLAFGLEYLDDSIKNPDEVKNHLGLPFLGMVPALFDKTITTPLLSDRVSTTFSEAFRSIRTNVLFSSANDDREGRLIVVTSTGPGEGKTVVSTNLAVALAQASQRVLLIDADMRKPRVHEVFSRQLGPGLSNILVGNAYASDAIQADTTPGLWLLSAGTHPPNPAELLGSTRFKEFMTFLLHHFDWVLVDTPPVMAVTDAPIVAGLAKGVLFVVGSEMTSRRSGQRAIEQLGHVQAKFIGAVLNRVDLDHQGYYYSQYYRREYTDYYESGGPPPPPVTPEGSGRSVPGVVSVGTTTVAGRAGAAGTAAMNALAAALSTIIGLVRRGGPALGAAGATATRAVTTIPSIIVALLQAVATWILNLLRRARRPEHANEQLLK